MYSGPVYCARTQKNGNLCRCSVNANSHLLQSCIQVVWKIKTASSFLFFPVVTGNWGFPLGSSYSSEQKNLQTDSKLRSGTVFIEFERTAPARWEEEKVILTICSLSFFLWDRISSYGTEYYRVYYISQVYPKPSLIPFLSPPKTEITGNKRLAT